MYICKDKIQSFIRLNLVFHRHALEYFENVCWEERILGFRSDQDSFQKGKKIWSPHIDSFLSCFHGILNKFLS